MKNKINLSFEKWFEKNKAMLCAIPAPYNAYKTVWEALLKIINTGTPQGEEIKNCPFCDSVSVKAKSKHGSIHFWTECNAKIIEHAGRECLDLSKKKTQSRHGIAAQNRNRK